MQEGRIAADHMAHSSTHVRVSSRDEGRATHNRAATHGALKHHHDYAICPRGTINIADGDRHAEPKKLHKCGFWATRGQSVVGDATSGGTTKKYRSKKSLIFSLKTRARTIFILLGFCAGGGTRTLKIECKRL